MYGYNSPFWSAGSPIPLPYGGTHDFYNALPLGGYGGILPNGETSLPWQSPADTGG
jgi:hypothetical protein